MTAATISLLRSILRTFALFLVFAGVYIPVKLYLLPPTENEVSYTNTNYYVFDLRIPSRLDFCGEKIPSNNYRIKRDLEKEFFNNAYWKNNSAILFQKAQRWFPYIEPILKQQGVPDDFKYLCVIESHLSNVTSRAGAAGFWQLVPTTARNYGLEVNSEVDERYDVEKATRAACLLIKDAYDVFKNWTLTAAAYNRGIAGIQNAMNKQNSDTYYGLLLNKETGSFVYRILAYKTLFTSPGHFDIKRKKWNYYPRIAFKTYKVDSSITNLSAFAKHVGSTVSTIRLHNPWLLENLLNNPSKKTYVIRIPKSTKADYSAYIKDLLPAEGYIETKSSSENYPNTTVMPIDTSSSITHTLHYVVKKDETLEALAKSLNVKVQDLRTWNKLNAAQQAVKGQTLILNKPVQ